MSERSESALLSAREAAAALGVRRDTLYAYVSRGLLTRRRRSGDRRSWFDPSEVDRLAARGRSEARPDREVRIESAVTALEGGHWFYRGHDPVALAARARFEQVAELLWTGELPAAAAWASDREAVETGRRVQRVLGPDVLPADRIRLVTAALAGTDPLRHDLRPEAVIATARRLLATLVESLPALRESTRARPRRTVGEPAAGGARSEGAVGAGLRSEAPPPLAARLWDRLTTRPPTPRDIELIDATLVILADHELAASTFAVRIAAALRADPYGAIGAGLGVLGGALHGAVSVAAEALLHEIAARGNVATVVEKHVRLGERLPGIGHPIYPDGDPRGAALLALLRRAGGDRRRLRDVDELLAAARARGFPPPNVDLGIAAVTHVLGFARGTGELIFSIARMAGWVAHALEEYARPSSIRPRAIYTGIRPGRREGRE
ncbi:MAG TPA: citrate/2-methylcitrate synthase [Candidatus Binatia bacterium]|nr:citrate/2-methylcitrate synthase [Candidatus Binatia bacterium]